MGHIHDSIDAIFSALGESMLTMQEGGGIGCDFSLLRPAGMEAAKSGNIASGPVSFMHVWNEACATLISTGSRRGAMMATLRCDHPDIERFVDAKRNSKRDANRDTNRAGGVLQHFNLSVLISDAFMQAVDADAQWQLVFPLAGRPVPADGMVCERVWSGSNAPEPCLVIRTIAARELWDRILRAAFDCGDPGVIFIDRVQRANNLWYTENISATNPCGEVPLPPHGACTLGSINLTQFIHDPFGRHPKLDTVGLADITAIATRMLDNVIDASHFPLSVQARVAHATRRIGLGITGLADAFLMLGVHYGSDASLEVADMVMRTISEAAYRASIGLARERGVFPDYRATEHLAGDFILSLPRDIQEEMRQHGIRNSHLTAIAPAGTISLLANNVSTGIEPIYAFQAGRKLKKPDGSSIVIPTKNYAWSLFRQLQGEHALLPDYFVEAHDVDPLAQLKMQSRLQAHVDQSISKTVNFSERLSFDQYRDVFRQAYQMGLKGCTVFRAGSRVDAALSPSSMRETSAIC